MTKRAEDDVATITLRMQRPRLARGSGELASPSMIDEGWVTDASEPELELTELELDDLELTAPVERVAAAVAEAEDSSFWLRVRRTLSSLR
jgi:hypothetical protein